VSAARHATPSRARLDEALVTRGLAETRSQARAFILAGDVTINGSVAMRAGDSVRENDQIALVAKPRFVSRGGEKLAHALERCEIDVSNRVVADFGASTGGFTDCLLQAGARHVYAVDVGRGQLHERLRTDDRVTVLDRTNARLVTALPSPVELVTIDVSFISLRLVLPAAARVLVTGGTCVPLIKPQFEAGARYVGKGGVVRDSEVHRRVLGDVLTTAEELGFGVLGLTRSPLKGPAGNVEFLAHLQLQQESAAIAALIDVVLAEGDNR